MAAARKKKLLPVSSQLEDRLKELGEKLSRPTTPEYNPQRHNDETRSSIALYFVKGFFSLIFLVIVGVPLYNLLIAPNNGELLSLKDLLPQLSGIVSGPLGFVIGHYFKSEAK